MSLSAKCIVVIAVISATTQVASAPYLPASSRNALPPFGHTVFCLRYPKDCEQSGSSGPVADTPARHTELDSVNRHVNASIAPKKEAATIDEKWLVAPLEGNCHDYAVTKRHDLLQKGWPSSSLRLAEVTINTGEHHLILVAEIEGEGFILDNLDPNVLSLAQTRSGYYWNRIESSDNLKFWGGANIGKYGNSTVLPRRETKDRQHIALPDRAAGALRATVASGRANSQRERISQGRRAASR